MKVSRRMLLLCGVMVTSGCSSWRPWAVRSQSPEGSGQDASTPRLVGDLASPFNVHPITVEYVGLVSGLKATGSDPRPSPERALLLGEMQTRGVRNPNAVLASPDTALVKVRATLRPGIQKDDRFDVEVRVPSQSETTSLRGGYLLQTELKEMAVLADSRFHSGHTYGVAEGPVLVADPSADPKKDRVLTTRGMVLGGGVARKSRPLGLVLRPEHKSVYNAARVQDAINKRFTFFDERNIKQGVANAQNDRYVELKLHPRYKDNVQRYMAVVRSIAIRESQVERSERLGLLEKQLLDPVSSSRAALQLEAVGKEAVPVLSKGIQSQDAEVRFYAAEGLAYLDETKAAEPLGLAARDVPAFRVYALTALSAMDDYAAADQLRQLLHVRSAETRYGAFRALWAMNPNEGAIRGESLSGQFSYHVIDTSAPPMIHVTRSRRAEIVLFGRDQAFSPPMVLEAGNRIMITAKRADEVVVAKFSTSEADQKRVVSNRVDDVIRAIVELGGTYPDVVQALQQAKAARALGSHLAVDALPGPGRRYDRLAAKEAEKEPPPQAAGDEEGATEPVANSPLPDLYLKPGETGDAPGTDKAAGNEPKEESERQKKGGPVKNFFARMMGREAS